MLAEMDCCATAGRSDNICGLAAERSKRPSSGSIAAVSSRRLIETRLREGRSVIVRCIIGSFLKRETVEMETVSACRAGDAPGERMQHRELRRREKAVIY